MRGEKNPTTYHDKLDEMVEHVLTTLALANTMEASVGEPREGRQRGVRGGEPWGRWGTDSMDPHVGCCLCPTPKSCPFLSAKSSPSTDTWPVMLNESSRDGAHSITAGAMDQAPRLGLEELFGTTSVACSVLGLGLVQPVGSRRGRVPVCVPAIRGEMRMVKGTVARDHEFN